MSTSSAATKIQFWRMLNRIAANSVYSVCVCVSVCCGGCCWWRCCHYVQLSNELLSRWILSGALSANRNIWQSARRHKIQEENIGSHRASERVWKVHYQSCNRKSKVCTYTFLSSFHLLQIVCACFLFFFHFFIVCSNLMEWNWISCLSKIAKQVSWRGKPGECVYLFFLSQSVQTVRSVTEREHWFECREIVWIGQFMYKYTVSNRPDDLIIPIFCCLFSSTNRLNANPRIAQC